MHAILRKDGRFEVIIPRRMSPSGKRKSHYFHSRTKADAFIRELRTELLEHGRQAITAEDRRWLAYWRARVGDLSLMPDVVRHWKLTGETLHPIPAIEAAIQYVEAVTGDYTNKRTLADVRLRMRHFGDRFGTRLLHEISTEDYERWLAGFNGYNRWSYCKRIKPFLKFALRRRWIAGDPMTDVPTPRTPEPKREIYSVEDFESLLTTAEKGFRDLLVYLVLAGWCYLRTSELVRKFANENVLQWTDVHMDEGLIHVPVTVAKGTRRRSDERYTPIVPVARHWLTPLVRPDGACVPTSQSHFSERWKALAAAAGVLTIPNGLRHSAISYALAGDPVASLGQIALAAGNSEATVRKHYRRLVKPEYARRWFRIGMPPEPEHGIYVGDPAMLPGVWRGER
jgi:site-specific recombinase XerD